MKRSLTFVPIAIAVIALGYIFYDRFGGEPPAPVVASDDYAAADVPLEVDHSAFKSTFLRPEVAALYGIDRADDLGVCVISVYQKESPGTGVQALVSGSVKNLMGQTTKLEFDEVREGEAAYHVCTFDVLDEEQLTFDVAVEIVQTGEARSLSWQQQF